MSEDDTSSQASNASRQQFIIALRCARSERVDPALMDAVAAQLEADPDVDVLKVSSPCGSPERLVVSMTAQRAERLRSEHSDQLIIEPNHPISLFSK
jgi:hypothetical protein